MYDFNMPSLLGFFSRMRYNTTPKWMLLLLGVFSLISAVMIVIIRSRNHHFQKSSKESPLCSGNLLDNREHHFATQADGSYDNSRMISKLGSCQLTRYTFEKVVGCVDALYERHYGHYSAQNSYNNQNLVKRHKKNMHFAFIGDSRIRQQFFNFLKLIPDYDRKSEPRPLPFFGYHGDMEVTSEILKLRISFQWRPLINDTVIDTIRQWATDSQADRPNLTILGMSVWHMLQSKGSDDFKLYQKQLERLAPFLSQLENVGKVIWLNQYPVVEKFGNTGAMNTNIFSDKIHHYNKAVRSKLQSYPHMRVIWDSSNPLVEEYIRGCGLFRERLQFGMHMDSEPDYSYINCNDFTHPGYSALSHATQLLLNDLC